jgi:hypothetical protein
MAIATSLCVHEQRNNVDPAAEAAEAEVAMEVEAEEGGV